MFVIPAARQDITILLNNRPLVLHNPPAIRLDLRKEQLLGFEPSVYDTFLESIKQGILLGDAMPPVGIAKGDDGQYHLTRLYLPCERAGSVPDGGHTRARAHYDLGRPLDCFLTSSIYIPEQPEYYPIADLMVERDEKEEKFREACKYAKYQPLQRRAANSLAPTRSRTASPMPCGDA